MFFHIFRKGYSFTSRHSYSLYNRFGIRLLIVYMVKKLLLVFLYLICLVAIMIIISLYLNTHSRYPCFSPSSTKFANKSSQYLWCVNHYGPNNQLRDFFKCAIISMMNNYTLILPPFYPHYRNRRKGIQWFEHFYDLQKFSSILNLITMDQFIQLQVNETKLFLDCSIQQIALIKDRTWYSLNTLMSIQNHYKIKIHFHRYINLTNSFNLNELFNKGKNCSSIFLHVHYTAFNHFFLTSNPYTKSIFENLYRNPLLQRLSSELINYLPQLVIGKNSSKTILTNLAVIHMRFGDHIVMNISMYIEQILYLLNNNVRFTHLHIMCPYLNSTDIKQLNDSLPIAFTTTQILVDHTRFILDDYLFDVFEQEIAYQAPIFLASPWTTYSATILMQKVYQGKGIVYVLSNKGNHRPILVTKKNVRYFK